MTSGAAELTARRVLTRLGEPHVHLTAIPSRRAHRQVFRAARDHGRTLYLKVFELPDDFEREADGHAAVSPDLAARLIVADETERTVVTEEATGTVGSDLPPEHQMRMLTHAVLAFEQLLTADIRRSIDPIIYPTEPRFQRHLQRLTLDAKDMASSFDHEVWKAQPLLPCHGDLTPYNIIASNSGVKLIDFEFLGIGQPLYDAASLCLSPTLSLPATARLTALLACSDAVAKAAGQAVSITMLACAAGVWSVRCAANLDDNPPLIAASPTPEHPLRIARDVIGILARLPIRQRIQPAHIAR